MLHISPVLLCFALALAEEKHKSLKQIAQTWGLSYDFVRDIFAHEEGVLRVTSPAAHGKRSYTTVRVPLSVAARVHAKLRTTMNATKPRPGTRDDQKGTL
jgi:hypothetical protein